jgi:hypothetical protein
MWYLLYWFLPAFVGFFILVVCDEKRITIGNIIQSLFFSLFGWLTVAFVLWSIAETYDNVTLVDFKRKKDK